MAGIYKRAVKVAPNTPILIAQAKGLKNILEKINGRNPPNVVKEVVIICRVDLITTSIRSDFDMDISVALSLI